MLPIPQMDLKVLDRRARSHCIQLPRTVIAPDSRLERPLHLVAAAVRAQLILLDVLIRGLVDRRVLHAAFEAVVGVFAAEIVERGE